MDCSQPGSSVHGIFLGKNTGVGCHFLILGEGNAGYQGSIPGLGRSPRDKTMAAHSSILAWRMPWTEEAGRL